MPLHLYDGTSAACTKKEMADNKDAFEAHVNKRICDHMNQDHAASVLAMAMALDPTANRARMASITKTSVTLDAVDGKDPKRRALVWPLDPPLADAGAARVRLVAIHHRVLRPAADQPAGAVVFVVMAVVLLAGLTSVGFLQPLRDFCVLAFPHKEGLKQLAGLLLFCHAIEALNALYVAKKKLKLGWGASLGWAAAALAVGVASLGRLNRLANARALAGSFAGKQE